MTEEKFLVTCLLTDLSENQVREHFTKKNLRVKHVTQEAPGKYLVILILDRQEVCLVVERDCHIDNVYVDIKRFSKYLTSEFLGCNYVVTGSLTVVKVGAHVIRELLSERDLLDKVSKAVSGTQGQVLFWIQMPAHVGLSVVKHKLPRDTGSHFGKICTAENFKKGFRKLFQRQPETESYNEEDEKAESDQALSNNTTNAREIIIPGVDRLTCKFLVQNTAPELLNCKMSVEKGLLQLRIEAVDNFTGENIQERCLAYVSQLDTARVALSRRIMGLFETLNVRSLIQALFDKKQLRCCWVVENDAILFVAPVKDHNAIREILETALVQRQMPLSKSHQSLKFRLESRLRERLRSGHSSIPAVFPDDLDEAVTIVDAAKHIEAATNIEETVAIFKQLYLECRLNTAKYHPDDQHEDKQQNRRTVQMVDVLVNTDECRPTVHASVTSSSSLEMRGRDVTTTVESSSHRTPEDKGRDLSLTNPKTAVNSQASSSPTGISSDSGISADIQWQQKLDDIEIDVLIRLLEQLSPLLNIGRFHSMPPSYKQLHDTHEEYKTLCSRQPKRMIDALVFLLFPTARDNNTFDDFCWLQELDTLNEDQFVKLSRFLNIKEAHSEKRSFRDMQQLLMRCKGIGQHEPDRMIHALITYFRSTVRTHDQQFSPPTAVAVDSHSPVTVVGSDRDGSTPWSSCRRGSQDSWTDQHVPPILPWGRSSIGPLRLNTSEFQSARSTLSEFHVELNAGHSRQREDRFYSCSDRSRPEHFFRRSDDHSISNGQQQPLDGAVMDLSAYDIPPIGKESHA